MAIYTIFTGGTIGSKKNSSGVISTDKDLTYKLINKYCQIYKENVEFITDEPYRILSENLSAANILKLVEAVNRAIDNDNVEGIIVTHGTDTLQYTSAILGYIFQDADVPIVLVSSNYVLDDSRANGLINFRNAVDFIINSRGKGVFVSYKNTDDFGYIHCATRLQSPILFSDNLSSVMNSWYGRFVADVYENNENYKVERNKHNVFDRYNIKLSDKADGIVRINPYVGMSYPVITENIKAVLHESYHSGTIGINKEFEEFALEAKKCNIPIFLTGLNSKEAHYETVDKYRSLGIITLPESSVISQYCKLWLALSNDKNIIEVMKMPMGADFISYS
jgi:L-asparaginase